MDCIDVEENFEQYRSETISSVISVILFGKMGTEVRTVRKIGLGLEVSGLKRKPMDLTSV